jgi:hypothetical protein
MRTYVAILTLSFSAALSLSATSLEKLSMEQLVERSTAIVQGRVLDSATMKRGSVIYTNYRIQVAKVHKGAAPATLEVSVPGGQFSGYRQSFSGTPRLESGAEYVIFVWTGRSGINHTIGLAQGVFDVKTTAAGQTWLTRGAIDALMLDASGKEAQDKGFSIPMSRLAELIRSSEAKLQ